MIAVNKVQVKVNRFAVVETSPQDHGSLASVTIDVDVELDVNDAGRFGGLSRAVEAIIADSNSRSDLGETDKDTIKLKIKRSLPTMQYRFARAGADNDDTADETGKLFDPSNPNGTFARALSFVGDAKNAEARIVKGVLSASWKLDAKLNPRQIATLATMVKTADVLLTSTSVQGALALDETKREESRKGSGKAAGESSGRGRKARRPNIAEEADALGEQVLSEAPMH